MGECTSNTLECLRGKQIIYFFPIKYISFLQLSLHLTSSSFTKQALGRVGSGRDRGRPAAPSADDSLVAGAIVRLAALDLGLLGFCSSFSSSDEALVQEVAIRREARDLNGRGLSSLPFSSDKSFVAGAGKWNIAPDFSVRG